MTAPPTHAERITQSLEALAPVNTQAIETFIDLAQTLGPLPPSMRILRTLRHELASLDSAARARAACMPHLLVEMHFRDLDWWRDAQSLAGRRMTRHEAPQFVPPKSVVSLARAALTLAWHTVRSEPTHATILLGVAESVTRELAKLSPSDVNRIAERYAYALTLRWADRPFIWGQLLSAARDDDAEAMNLVQMRALQLLGGDLLLRTA